MKSKHLPLLLSAGVALAATGCSSLNTESVLPDKTVDYKKERQSTSDLEVPPDLTTSSISNRTAIPGTLGAGSASYSELATRERLSGQGRGMQGGVLPKISKIRVMRDGDQRWLLIDAPPEAVWPRVVDFWQGNGIILVEQDPTLGTMRTSWLENRADIKSDVITDAVRSVFSGAYEAGTRDQYRVRLERGERPGTTELYLTHYGMEQKITTGSTGESENEVWVPRGRDPQLEAEMLRRLMAYLGVADQKARAALAAKGKAAASRSRLVKGRDGAALIIAEPLNRAWRLTGLALDQVGFAVEDRDRSAGVYYVRYNDPAAEQEEGGLLSKLAFWSSDDETDKSHRYQVLLRPRQDGTLVTIRNEQGQRDQSPTALRILTLIHERLR